MNITSFEHIANNPKLKFDATTGPILTSTTVISQNYLDNAFMITDASLLLRNSSNKEIIRNLLSFGYYNWLPEYFFTTPASSTGKYHPAFANRKNGLVLHTIAAMHFLVELCDIVDLDNNIFNEMIAAIFFHDMFKYGDPATYKPGKYTDHGHPTYAADFLKYIATSNIYFSPDDKGNTEMLLRISNLVAKHMGPYTTNKYSNIVLQAPETCYELIVHKADLLASKKETSFVERYIT